MKVVSPGAGVWRVGRTPDPIEFPDPPKADELDHSRAGNRFDSPTENFRVCYFATDLETCFGETLARFRPDPALIAAADEHGFMPAGEVPADWRNQRIAVQAEFMPSELLPELRFLDVEALSTRRKLRTELASLLPTTATRISTSPPSAAATDASLAGSRSGHSSTATPMASRFSPASVISPA